MLDLPTSNIYDFVLYRAPQTTYIEVFVFPDDLDVCEVFEKYPQGHCLSVEQEMSIDSYLIDYSEEEDLGIANRAALLSWLKNINVPEGKASKIVDAIFCWNLVYVTLADPDKMTEVDAVVPKHQKHPIITEPSKRDIKVTQEDKYKFNDGFDPLLNHINNFHKANKPSN